MNIKETISVLNQMKADRIIGQYAIGGAVAANLYVEVADTVDVDVYIILDPLPGQSLVSPRPIYSYLESLGFSLNKEGLPLVFGWPVQFLPADKPLLKEALDQSIERDIDGVPMRVFTAEHLAAIAFDVGRPKDRLRVDQFRGEKAIDAGRLRQILERHGLLERWIATRGN
ncbi:MAG: hypothetical protein QOD12_1974 [Verrucomicrobiota bacterium]|jgi:hypothetical protein